MIRMLISYFFNLDPTFVHDPLLPIRNFELKPAKLYSFKVALANNTSIDFT